MAKTLYLLNKVDSIHEKVNSSINTHPHSANFDLLRRKKGHARSHKH